MAGDKNKNQAPPADTSQEQQAPAAQGPTPEQLAATVAEQQELIADQSLQIQQLSSQVDKLMAASPKRPENPELPQGTFKYKGEEYRVVHGVQVRVGNELKTYSAAQVLKNKELCVELVESNSSAIQAV